MARTWRLVALLVGAQLACFDASFLLGQPCTEDGECAPAFTCDEGFCGGGQRPPAVSDLGVEAVGIKQIELSWSPVAFAEFYLPYERPHPELEAVEFDAMTSADGAPLSLGLNVPLHLRGGAAYGVRACNEHGCAPRLVSDDPHQLVDPAALTEAIGYFKPSEATESFGAVVVLSGDGRTLAVGAGSGEAVHVFVRDEGLWSEAARLSIEATGSPPPGATFGVSLAISADGERVAVGEYAPSALDGRGQDTPGAVHVFDTSNGWAEFETTLVRAVNTEVGDLFGWSVALSDDGQTMVVGAPGEGSAAGGVDGDELDDSAPWAGATYVFRHEAGAWTQDAYIKVPDAAVPDTRAGWAVALSGDGAVLAFNAYGSLAGVYVHGRDEGGSWGLRDVFARPGDVQEIGQALALDAQGHHLAFSARGFVDTHDIVWLLEYDEAGARAMELVVEVPNMPNERSFGESLALSRDASVLALGDAADTASFAGVRAQGPAAVEAGPGSGAVLVYTIGDELSLRSHVKAPNPDPGDGFGYRTTVSLSADGSSLAVGAPGEASAALGIGGDQADNSMASAGAVYLY